MSVMDRDDQKVSLPRCGIEDLWVQVQKRLDRETNPQLWRNLAMFTLREVGGWTLEQVGQAFQLHRGHVLRCIREARQKLRTEFEATPVPAQVWERITDPLDEDGADERAALGNSLPATDWQTDPDREPPRFRFDPRRRRPRPRPEH